MLWRLGQKIICVNDTGWSRHFLSYTLPIKGRVYTIREIQPSDSHDGSLAFLLYEIENEKHTYFKFHKGIPKEPSFRCYRFRPVITKETSIDVFTAMLRPVGEMV